MELNMILDDLETNKHMWSHEDTSKKVIEAFEILRDLVEDLAKKR